MRNSETTEIQALVRELPVRSFDTIYHVGCLDAEAPDAHAGLEGPCLAVSMHPDAWIEIARLGGLPTWEIRAPRRRLALYDLLSFSAEAKAALLDAAKSLGLVTEVVRFKAWFYDSESDDCGECQPDEATCSTCTCDNGWRYFDLPTRDKAEEEAAGCEDERPFGAPLVEEYLGYEASAELIKWWAGKAQKLTTRAVKDAAMAYLLQLHGSADGLWWDELLDPSALSAPRGGLFQPRLQELEATTDDWSQAIVLAARG